MKKNALSSTCYKIEGNLFLSNQLDKAFAGQNRRQKPADYQLPPGITLKEECSRAFRIGKASWDIFSQAFDRTDLSEQDQLKRTKEFAKNFIGALGYTMLALESIDCQERQYPIAFEARGLADAQKAANLPVALTSYTNTLDTAVSNLAVTGSGYSKKSAFSLIQELLNASEEYRWGFAFNGTSIRLVRDSMSLTRPSFLEFNLQEIFANDDYAEFTHLWLVLHASRATISETKTAWDVWILEGEEAGQPARDALSASITVALQELGNGFLQEPSNAKLRELLANGTLSAKEYTHELLRMMYRLLFVFCLEERDLLHVQEETDANLLAQERYKNGYSLHRYREMSRKKRFHTAFTDMWESVCIVFEGLEKGLSALALPALGGLFKHSQCPHLSEARLSNAFFLRAMYSMRWATINDVFAAIDYRNMGTEELGSIYESLLELVPVVDTTRRVFGFMNNVGTSSERKETGSYYTPDAFVQLLIKSALDPVIEKRLKEATGTPEEALLAIRVIDPACGSGHFLLAAARRIAERLALVRSSDGAVTPANYRVALRDVIQHCIYGVDLNPLAVELARMALWLEGYAEGMPLSFLDHHLKVGNSIIGVFDLNDLKKGISKEAFKPCGLDDKNVCAELAADNKKWLKALLKQQAYSPIVDPFEPDESDSLLSQLESMHPKDLAGEASKETLYEEYRRAFANNHTKRTCDLQIGAYLCDKTLDTMPFVPTSEVLGRALYDPALLESVHQQSMDLATEACSRAHVFHWPLEFPQVFANGGFDCILGNPPWEKAKVEDAKWFAKRQPTIAASKPASIRKQMIDSLAEGQFSTKYLGLPFTESQSEADKSLFVDYMTSQKNASAGAILGHLPEEAGGRFPLTGTGDTNLSAYFSELALHLRKDDGAIGLVVPVGIITDDATKAYSQYILDGHTQSLYHFNNTEKLFPIHSSYSYVLITLRDSDKTDCVFYASRMEHLDDPQRHVVFEKNDLKLFNPNTRTCVLMRSKKDLELCRRLYRAAPVLIREDDDINGNPWGIRFLSMFHMTNDSGLFESGYKEGYVPLYEGKLFHQFDNRWATYDKFNKKGELVERDVTQKEKENSAYRVLPKSWVNLNEVINKFTDKQGKSRWWSNPWMLAFRSISRSTDERTVITSVLPSRYAAGNSCGLLFPKQSPKLASCLLANLNTLVLDFVARIKQSGANLNLFVLKQLPLLPPTVYSDKDVQYIESRVAKLTRNNNEIQNVWLTDYPRYQFQEPEERLKLRAELDAYFAHLYGLTRDELRYILDPSDVMGDNFPSVTFPGLKRNEMAAFGEFLTCRLVLEAYDKLAKTERFAQKSEANA